MGDFPKPSHQSPVHSNPLKILFPSISQIGVSALFRGRFEHSFDEKGRLAIPSRFRDLVLDRNADGGLIVTNFDQCLAVYSLSQWEDLERRIAGLPQFDLNVSAFLRYFISGATECQLDKSGRILVPASLRQTAEIEHDCMVVGQLTRFEIWSTDRWSKAFSVLNSDFATITKGISQFGITL